MPQSTKNNKKLPQLRKQFRDQLPGRVSELATLAAAYLRQPEHATLHRLYISLHSLAGSAGSFGAFEISKLARDIELTLQEAVEQHRQPGEQAVRECMKNLQRLRRLADDWAPVETAGERGAGPGQPEPHRLVYIVDGDHLFADKTASLLNDHGFDTAIFQELQHLVEALAQESPDALLVDLDLTRTDSARDNIIAQIQSASEQSGGAYPPVIFTSEQDNIETRYEALNAGGTRYLAKPLDINNLVNTIENIAATQQHEPYHVLLVDDDQTMLAVYKAILEKVGIIVTAIHEPDKVFEVLDGQTVDLLVLDVNMPGYNGLQLAAMLRQDDNFSLLPILFLTSDSDIEKKLSALDLGGDDYITKPVAAERLASSILARARRSRWVRRLYDDLHTALQESGNRMHALDSHAIVSITDTRGVITAVNRKFCEISGYAEDELVGRTHAIVNSGYHDRSFFSGMWQTISQGKLWHGRICNRAKNGNEYWVDSTIVPFLDEAGVPYQYVSVRTDITPLIQQQNNLIDAKLDADRANKAKSEFLSSMSHELRTPMNAILGFSQLLELTVENEEQTGYVREILKAGNYLLDLINEVLDLSKIEAGKIDLSIEPVDLCLVLQECLSLVERLALERGIDITFRKEGVVTAIDDPGMMRTVVSADRTRLKQVLLNLISNAVKYNKNDGSVIIDCDHAGTGSVRVSVVDTGIGISAGNLQRLFHPFERLGHEGTGIEGTGIGLVITRNLVELMNGRIGADSAEGKGSTFWVELPLHSLQQAGEDYDEFVANMPVPEMAGATHNVLYIEDNPVNLKLVNALLSKLDNVNVHSVPDPKLGIEAAVNEQPDLILLDINLPGMHGYEVFKTLQQFDETRHIPVIAVSANAMHSDINMARSLGFAEYIVKPINVPVFLQAVGKYLGR